MPSIVREIRFEAEVLAEVERRLAPDEQDLSEFVNAAVEHELRRRRGHLRLVREVDLTELARSYAEALLARDAPRARAVILDAVDAGTAIVDVYADVLRPALGEVGDRWAHDEITVADEHYATEVTERLLSLLDPEGRTAPAGGRMAVVSGSPDELHALGARMVADVLERHGWEVLSLGAATPCTDLVELVSSECPDVVALSTATAGRLPGLEEALVALHALEPRPLVAVGGSLYTAEVAEAARGWGADVVTSDLHELLAELAQRFPAS